VKLSEKQKYVVGCANKRINIAEGAVRSSKTVAMNMRWLKFISQIDQHDWSGQGGLALCGVSAQSVYRNMVQPLAEAVGKHLRYSSSQQKVTLYGRDMYIFGAKDAGSEAKIRGLTLGGAMVDEWTLMHESFFRQLMARLSAPNAKVFLTTNPDSPKHYAKTEFVDRAEELDIFHTHWILEDNPFLEKAYVDSLKQELTGVFYRRMILGEWAAAEGMIYDFFEDREPYVVSSVPAAERFVIGLDYGIQNLTACVLMGYRRSVRWEAKSGDPEFWAEDEWGYSGRANNAQLSDEELCDRIEKWLGDRRHLLDCFYVDPSATSMIVALKRRNFSVKEAANAVIDGIQCVSGALKSGRYVIHKRCKELIKEKYMYQWDKAAQLRGEDQPKKADDHYSDGERYAAFTRWGQNRLDYSKLTQW
jgi:PBSX family phage terminase large subunit